MSAQANNPSQLDLYVEKIVSYMNLDDAQRLDVVREIRDHLEQSIATAQMRGIPQDRAEKEAIQKFGNPHTLAGNFGTNGTIWMAFEAIAYAIAVFVLYWFGFSRVPDWPFVSLTTTTALAAIIAFFAVAARLWNRVQVNGQLKIYRFLRPTLHIPFENISEVRLDRFHLFGPKRVHLSFGNQHTNYSASWLNARCVGIALEVLVPQAIHPKAAIYFRRLRLNNGQEPLTLKLLVTIGWLALAGLLALTFQPLWNNEGISIWFGIVLIGVILSAWIQYAIHASRLKRTVSLLLASILTVFIPIVIANSILTPDGFRALVLFVALLLPVPLLMLWVPDRNRSRSLVIFAVWIVLALFAYYRTPKETLITNGYLFTSPGLVNNATWLSTPQNKNAVLAAVSFRSQEDHSATPILNYVNISDPTKSQKVKLANGDWIMAGIEPTSSNPLLLRSLSPDLGDNSTSYSVDIYKIENPPAISRLASISGAHGGMAFNLPPEAVVSPDGKYVVLSATLSEETNVLGILNLNSDKLTRVQELRQYYAWRWTSSNTLEVFKPDQQPASGEYSIVEVNADTGKTTLKRSISIGRGYGILPMRSDRYAIIRSEDSLAIADLDKGTSVPLPLPDGLAMTYSWQPQIDRIAYLGAGNGEFDSSIVIAGPEGVIAEVLIGSPYEVNNLKLSPDGNKVLIVKKRKQRWFIPLGQIEVLDLERKISQNIGRIPVIGTIMGLLSLSDPYPPVQWTPNSRSLLWTHTTAIFENGETETATAYFLADYEEWAETGMPAL